MQMLCMLLLEPGDGVLTEQYSYSHLVEHTLKLRGNHALPVAMDALGVQPAALRTVLQASLFLRNVAVIPAHLHVIYTLLAGLWLADYAAACSTFFAKHIMHIASNCRCEWCVKFIYCTVADPKTCITAGDTRSGRAAATRILHSAHGPEPHRCCLF